MPSLMLADFENDLLARDLRVGLRPFRRTARRYIRQVLLRWRQRYTWQDPVPRDGDPQGDFLDKALLRRTVAALYRKQYGFNPFFFWILGIVIQLIWQWWLSRHDRPGAAAELRYLQEEAGRAVR